MVQESQNGSTSGLSKQSTRNSCHCFINSCTAATTSGQSSDSKFSEWIPNFIINSVLNSSLALIFFPPGHLWEFYLIFWMLGLYGPASLDVQMEDVSENTSSSMTRCHFHSMSIVETKIISCQSCEPILIWLIQIIQTLGNQLWVFKIN